MANVINLAEKYLPILDEIYRVSARSSILDSQDVKFINANTVQLFMLSMQGLGDYDRSKGFLTGDVAGSWQPYELTQDRGRSFTIDTMDNEETINMSFGKLVGEFLRTRVVPEIDAYTFAVLSGKAANGSNGTMVPGTTEVGKLIENASEELDADEVPDEGRIIFMSETTYNGLKQKTTRGWSNELELNTNVLYYNDMRVIRVPQRRFYTGIALKTGKAGQEEGGYVIPDNGSVYPVHFMIVHPSAVHKVAKHVKPRIFPPDVNQQADGWKFDYRIYHDVFVEENKKDGIYLYRGNTAVT